MSEFIKQLLDTIAAEIVEEDREAQEAFIRNNVGLIRESLITGKPINILGVTYDPVESVRKLNKSPTETHIDNIRSGNPGTFKRFGTQGDYYSEKEGVMLLDVDEPDQPTTPKKSVNNQPRFDDDKFIEKFMTKEGVTPWVVDIVKNFLKRQDDRERSGVRIGKQVLSREEITDYLVKRVVDPKTKEGKKFREWSKNNNVTRSPDSLFLEVYPPNGRVIKKNLKLHFRRESKTACKPSRTVNLKSKEAIKQKQTNKWQKIAESLYYIPKTQRYVVQTRFKVEGKERSRNSPHFKTEIEAVRYLAEYKNKSEKLNDVY